LDPVLSRPQFAGSEAPALALSAIASIVALAGIIVAWIFYLRLPGLPVLLAFKLRGLYTMLSRKYYIDEIYDALFSAPLFWLSANVFHRGVDVALIDGFVDGTGLTVEGSGEGLRQAETGNVQHYAFVYLIGAIAIVAYYIYRVTG
jgi:NADH-quinone oxidoreductase subunit L